jgi:hypothetical protein
VKARKHLSYLSSVVKQCSNFALLAYLSCSPLSRLWVLRERSQNFTFLDSLKVVYITFSSSKFKYASAYWNVSTLEDPSQLESVQSKFANLCYNRLFNPSPIVIMNQCWIICISKRLTPGYKILTPYFILTFSKRKVTVNVGHHVHSK